MNCANCGVAVVPDAKFCQNCGRAIFDATSAASVSPAGPPPQLIEPSPEEKPSPALTSSVPKKVSQTSQWVAKLWRTALTILVTVIIGWIAGVVSPVIRGFLAQADEFAWTGVTKGQPFHFCAVFYRELVHGGFPPLAFFRAIGDIMNEGPAAVLTMALALFIGIAVSYDRKNLLNTLYTTLFLGPVIGGCLLYVLMAVMLGLSAIFHVGAMACTFIGSMVPLTKEAVHIAIESRKEKLAEKIVKRVS